MDPATLAAAAEAAPMDQPVQLLDNDMEWTFELPPVLKKKFRSMADQIRELADAIKLLEAALDKKVGKVECTAMLQRKVDRDELDALFAAQRAEIERWKSEMDSRMTAMAADADRRFREMHASLQEQLDSERKARESALTRLQATLDQQASDLRSLSDTGDSTTKLLQEEMERRMQALQTRLQDESRARQADVQSLAARTLSLEDSAKRHSATLDTLTSSIRAVTSDLQAADDRLSRQLGALREEMASAAAAQREVDADLRRIASQAGDDATRAMREMRALEKELTERIRLQSEEAARRSADLESRCAHVEDTVLHTRATLDAVARSLSDARLEHESTAKRVLSLEEAQSGMHRTLSDMRTTVSEVENAMASTRSQVTTALHDMQRAVSVVEEKMEGEIKTREAIVARLEHLENLQELVQALEGAIQTETDTRIASDNEIMDLLVAMKRAVYEQLAQKSNVEDVRRALWLKVDKADLPVALSTRPAAAPDAPAQCVSCEAMPEGQRCLSCDTRHKTSAFPPPPPPPRAPSPRQRPRSSTASRPQSPRVPPLPSAAAAVAAHAAATGPLPLSASAPDLMSSQASARAAGRPPTASSLGVAATATALYSAVGGGGMTPRGARAPSAAERAWGKRSEWALGS